MPKIRVDQRYPGCHAYQDSGPVTGQDPASTLRHWKGLIRTALPSTIPRLITKALALTQTGCNILQPLNPDDGCKASLAQIVGSMCQ